MAKLRNRKIERSDMWKVTRELTVDFLLSILVSITKERCLLESVPSKQSFDGHAFEYNRNIWIEQGGTMRNNGNVHVSSKRLF